MFQFWRKVPALKAVLSEHEHDSTVSPDHKGTNAVEKIFELLKIPLNKELTANFIIETGVRKLEELIPTVMVLKIWADLDTAPQNSPYWYFMEWYILGHSGTGQQTVKCAETTWNNKVREA